jgi:hypothetical protein
VKKSQALSNGTRSRRWFRRGLPPSRRRALNQWVKTLITNFKFKVKVRVKKKAVNKRNVKKTRSRSKTKRKTYLTLSAIIIIKKDII